MLNSLVVLLACALLKMPVQASPGESGSGARLPVPEPGRISRSEGQVRDLFKADYAKSDPVQCRSFASSS
jgi:hypothetical protein